ncbi:hypothetical protein G4B88_008689 [Cannabis sativa]|uniref:Uncharacterized protein n=1 Tax=Cannabis sativa TaxID=3483 RepID=A0A7J6DX93_CANSA|nr:hypothetical protein G4B88_008689 [Cannabis sativa]
MDVPEMMLKLTRLLSLSNPVGAAAPVHPASMFTPGAIKSGLSISGVIGFGPLELKAATTACSIPANISVPKHPPTQHTLYVATRAVAAIPRAVPEAKPNRLASETDEPAAVVVLLPTWHSPFHLVGGFPSPVSSKLLLSGHTPVSKTPITTSLTLSEVGKIDSLFPSPRNSGVRVAYETYPYEQCKSSSLVCVVYRLLLHINGRQCSEARLFAKGVRNTVSLVLNWLGMEK